MLNPYNKTAGGIAKAVKTAKKAVAPQAGTLYGNRTSLKQGAKGMKTALRNAKNPWAL